MRPRAGTQPVTLEPSRVIEVLNVARHHDQLLKETRQDLFRVETQLRVERAWKWFIRAGCIALGAAALAGFQNEILMTNLAEMFGATGRGLQSAGAAELLIFAVITAAACGAVYVLRRVLRKPSPEQAARKLMEEFAKRDGVAAYVFTDESADDVAESIGTLTREENKTFRQRRLTPTMRTLTSSLTSLLNPAAHDTSLPYLH